MMKSCVMLVVLLLVCAPAPAANLVLNPSAETGALVPDSWRAIPASRASWETGGARFGQRCLGLDAGAGPAAWRGEAAAAEALQGYRLSGWIRCDGGLGWVEARFLNSRGRAVNIVRSPTAAGAEWLYVARDIPAADVPSARSVSVVCRAQGGRCLFDGLRLAPLDRNLLPNPELAPVTIGDKPDPSGAPAGWHALPATETRPLVVEQPAASQAKALLLGDPGPAAAASYLVDLPASTAMCALGADIETDGAVRCAISWFGPRGWIKDDAGTLYPGDGGMKQVVITGQPPADARRVRGTFTLVSGEWALVRPRRLVAVTAPQAARAVVYVNQVGYEPGARKAAVVASTIFPARLEDARFLVMDESGAQVSAGRLVPLGRVHEGQPDDWGDYYWLADFSDVGASGRFRVTANVGGRTAVSYPFGIERGALFRQTAELAYRFLYYQRCGTEVPGWHGACHLDDARLPDGSHADLTGGWHDAGDYNKWMYPEGPPLVLYGLASAYAAHPGYFDAIDRDGNGRADIADEMLWGADWLARMRNPHSGGIYGSVTTGWGYWGPPERETDNIAGTADDRPVADEQPAAALTAAALAKVAQCVPWMGARSGDRAKSSRLQEKSRPFERAAVQLEAYSREREGLSPDRLLACLELWRLTGRDEYLEQARACADQIAQGAGAGRQGRSLAALALFVACAPDARGNDKYRRAIEDSVAWLKARQAQPFAAAAGRGDADDMGNAERLGAWGRNMTLTSNAWAALACARATGSREPADSALAELDWFFGLNPLGLCMLHGAGSANPRGYHHRYFDHPAHRDGAVPGAIPNGVARRGNRPDLDLPFFDEVNRDPTSSEPWIPYTGYYLCALGLMEAGD